MKLFSHAARLLLFALLLILAPARAQAPATGAARPLRVLTISGDWKSQPWYQDVWMQGKGTDGKGEGVKYRGRFIAQEVGRATPGRFEFTDITNATGQQYGDQLFARYDVVVMGDIVGWSLPPRFHAALQNFVRGGGGLVYAASYKWDTALLKDTVFEAALPATFPASGITEDWKAATVRIGEKDFVPRVTPGQAAHPIVAGLDFAAMPALDAAFIVRPRPGTQVLLQSPEGAPILVAQEIGRGRSVLSASIFANDELSSKIGGWKDFGRFYAQLLGWAGANSTRAAVGADAPETVSLRVDATGAGANAVSAKYFGLHASHDDPGLAPLKDEALQNFEALNLRGAFTRFSPQGGHVEAANDDADPNHFELARFNFKNLDEQMVQIRRLNLEPLLLLNDYYGNPKWFYEDGSTWSDPSEKAIAEIAENAAACIEHLNGGRGNSPNYKLNVRYLEISNEPDLQGKTLPGFVRMFKAVARRIHRDYPGVQVGTFGGYEIPYLPRFLEMVNPDCDWISRHPYGWTGEMVMANQDSVAAWMKERGLREIPFIITEWDFWIQGREKFDYMMRRNFEAVRRDNLLGTLHYRLGQYPEPIYLFGALWTGWGQERGAGAKGTPMHDAYDAFYLWRDFRGQRVPVVGTTNHLLADAVRDGDKISAVVYNDWAAAAPARVSLNLQMAPSTRARTMSIVRAGGAGFEAVGPAVPIPPGARTITHQMEVAPNTGVSVSIR